VPICTEDVGISGVPTGLRPTDIGHFSQVVGKVSLNNLSLSFIMKRYL